MKQLFLALILVSTISCTSTVPATVATPAPPNSPQTQVLNIDKTLADAISTVVKTAITLRDSGKLSQANTTIIENWAKSAAAVDDAIATELGSSDLWPVQKQKIFLLLTTVKVPGSSTLDISIQTALSAVSSLITQLQTQVTQ
jgi:hypothetical protein